MNQLSPELAGILALVSLACILILLAAGSGKDDDNGGVK